MAFDEYGGLDPEAESFDSFAQYLLRSTLLWFDFPFKISLDPQASALGICPYI
jgi:hypothetical protein